MKSISAILIYFGLQAIAGVLLPSNIFLAMLLSTLLSIALFFAFRYISLADYDRPQKVWQIALLALAFLLPSLALQELFSFDTSNIEAVFSQIFNTPLTAFVCVGVAVPVAEEMMFRGMVQTQLQSLLQKTARLQPGRSSALAIVLSAAIFALFHLEPAQMPHAFLVGLILGALRHGYSLTASTVFHIVNNSAVFAMTMTIGSEDTKLLELFGGNILLLGVCILLTATLSAFLIYSLTKKHEDILLFRQ